MISYPYEKLLFSLFGRIEGCVRDCFIYVVFERHCRHCRCKMRKTLFLICLWVQLFKTALALKKEQGYARMSQNKLNGNFAQHAPAELVEKEKQILEEANRKIEKLQSYIDGL